MTPTRNPFLDLPQAEPSPAAFRPFAGDRSGAHEDSSPSPVAEPDALRRLTAETAHDFNNLLSVILACASELELLLEGAEGREQAGEIRTAAERGAKLSRKLIGAARPAREPRRPTDVNAALINASKLMSRSLGPEVELKIEPAAGLPQVSLSAERIEQILLNLVANARDAMPAGGLVTVRTSLTSIEPGDEHLGTGWHVKLSLSDPGIGMDTELQRLALEPFFTTKSSGEGSGLGLPTIVGIARSVDGDVRITSAPGLGTTVSIYLPAIGLDGRTLALPRTKFQS